MLTSSGEMRDVEAAYRSGANSYLVKPAAPQDMLEVIRGIGLYWLALNVPPPEDGLRP